MKSPRLAGMALALVITGCRNDASFTKLADPEPPAEDTSAPPVEVDADVSDEPAPECPDPGLVPATVATTREDCQNEPIQTTFRPEVEWALGRETPFPTFPSHYLTTTHPSVGHITDDNGDGIIGGEGDIPDIAASFWDGDDFCRGTSWTSHVLRLVSGDGSVEHWSVSGIPGLPGWEVGTYATAMGDVDGDGRAEVVLMALPVRADQNEDTRTLHRVVAFNHDGSLAWASEPRDDGTQYGCGRGECHATSAPFLVDLDQDGVVEVLVGPGIYDGRDGSAWEMPENWGVYGNDALTPLVADLEADGSHELITRLGIYESDLTPRCAFGWSGEYPAVADLDGDGIGEVVLSGARQLVTFDSSCRFQNVAYSPDDGHMGPPTIADYDGDGQPEIGVASYDYYFVFETDLTERWRQPVSDRSSNFTGSSVYDFEGDGYAEVVYAGEYNLWIYSGVDGTVRMQERTQYSCTSIEYPLTVDADGDGQVEIVVVDGNGIRVVGDRDNGWVPARQVWNQHAYSIFNVNDDLSIPTYNQPNWPDYNSFRSADQRLNNGEGAKLVDAFAMEVDRCEIECDAGIIQLTVRSANQGLADAEEGLDLAIYAEQVDGSSVLLESIPADAAVRSSYTTEGYTLRLEMTDIPTGTLILVADDDGTGTGVIEECDEDNNELRLEGLCADE